MKYLKLVICILLALSSLLPTSALATTSLLANPGFNNPFTDITTRIWHEQYEKIASGWTPFYIDANTYPGSGDASKLHWMSSAQFGAAFGGYDYHIEGDQSQVMWSSYQFDAGVYQQISGLTPGQAYKFDVGMAAYWRGPGYPDTNGKMVKVAGIDPYGGTDPTSPNVIWSQSDANDKAWVGLFTAATAEASTVTVFAKTQAPENDSYNHTDLDMVFFEDAHLESIGAGPVTSLNAVSSGINVNLNWAGSATPGWSLKGYEVQYKDQAGGDWLTLQAKTSTNTSGSFTGQAAHTYIVRVRTWQTSGGPLDMPGRWVEKSVTVANAVAGRVTNQAGMGLSGVNVAANGTVTATVSDSGGNYGLPTGAGTFEVIADNVAGFVAPPPTTVTVPADGIGELVITMRPTGPDQALTNNDFETDLSGWDVSGGSAAAVSTADWHTGQGSLYLSGPFNVAQSGNVSGMPRPLLSFWYKSNAPFTVEFLSEDIGTTGLSPTQSRTLSTANQWTFFTLQLGLNDVYTGTLGVNFSYSGPAANIYIDEVSIAEGPYQIFLPVVLKN